MGFAKILDEDSRTMSLRNLLGAARKNIKQLLPHITPQEFDELEKRILEHEPVRGKIEQLRNQYLAHLDANPQPVPELIKGDIDKIHQGTPDIFNDLSVAQDRSRYYWSTQSRRSAWETSEILSDLRKAWESERRQIRPHDAVS